MTQADASLNLDLLYEQAGFKPNAQQEEAILHTDGPLFLTAGPGSGKTRVLLWRTLNLIVFHGVKPDEIYLSTFTEKAAHQLTEGLKTILGMVSNINQQPYDLAQMYVGTVHSLCNRILNDRRRFVTERHRSQIPVVMDEVGQYFHLFRNNNWLALLEAVGLGEDDTNTINTIFNDTKSISRHKAVTSCMSVFNRFSEECIDPQKAIRLLKEDASIATFLTDHEYDIEKIDLLFKLYGSYRDSLIGENNTRQTDFALMQQDACQVLDEFPGSSQVFKHVIVDEYQDTNTIQERIFFKLARGSKNICVVGDDDQALYRFRGATVENFVEFPARCQKYLGSQPKRLTLATNYRSRNQIVDFYKQFMDTTNWSKGDGSKGYYRVVDKNIQADRIDNLPAVVACEPGKPDVASVEIANFVRKLIDEKKVENPNQIAFLFPSLKYDGEMVKPVLHMKAALEAVGLKVYAPRAGRFLDVDESYDIFGLFLKIFGLPKNMHAFGHDGERYADWLGQISDTADGLMEEDPLLKKFVEDRRLELGRVQSDFTILNQVAEQNHWNTRAPYDLAIMKRKLYEVHGISESCKRILGSNYSDQLVRTRAAKGKPLSLFYIMQRATSIDWNVLDLFYLLCGFEHFKRMFDAAEKEGDEGPLANLSLISQYLERFIDSYVSMITADLLVDKLFQQLLFASYLYALYRLAETEYENDEDPFPKGRIPFITIHQAKGLEFPVVVLGNLQKRNRGAQMAEILARPFLERDPGEPLDRQGEFDTMRMFYVALSRAKNLLILSHYQGQGYSIHSAFKEVMGEGITKLKEFKFGPLPKSTLNEDKPPKTYSFTADYLMYKKCPRQYMIFRKYGFVPARSQILFFGSLVHQTLEDLHHELIRRRTEAGKEGG